MPKFTDIYDLKYPWLKNTDDRSVKCCLCGGKHKTADRLVFKINSKFYRIRECLVDGLMFLSPQPGQKYLNSLYNHPSYFQGADDMYGLAVDEEKSKKIARIRIDEILKYKNNASSILEIGCAYGHTLVAAKEAGFKMADGLEFSKDAVRACRDKGLRVFLSSSDKISLASIKKNRYDVIAMYSVLEHVRNPLVFLKKMIPMIASQGIIVIRVPEMSASGPWLSLLDHTWHFTRKSMKRLLGKVNLSVVDIFSSGKFIGLQHGGELSSMTVIVKK